jgi:hypothetical protein
MISRFYLIFIALVVLAINSHCKRSESNIIKDIDDNICSNALIGDYWWMTEKNKRSITVLANRSCTITHS